MKASDQQESKLIKVILPGVCPHCDKKILTAIKSFTPTIEWTLKESASVDAKNKVIESIEKSKLPVAEKKQAMAWIEGDEVIFGPDDVEPVLKQIIK